MKNMSGRWVVDKGLSDDWDALLALQGIPWWKRQAAGLITVTEHITHTISPSDDVHRILIEQRMTGGFKGGEDEIFIDGLERASVHSISGAITSRASWTDPSDLEDEWLIEGWCGGEEEKGGPNGEKHMKTVVKSEIVGWEMDIVWGFVMLGGERYHSRRMVCRKEGVVERARIIYGWLGPKLNDT
jgi:hypothetical protein